MALTAHSIDSCGTTYEYHTTRSQRDYLATDRRSELSPLHRAVARPCRVTLEALCRHISLAESILPPPPPPKRAQRRPLGDCAGAIHHPYHTNHRLTQQASARFVVSLRACATLRPAQALCCIPRPTLHTLWQ